MLCTAVSTVRPLYDFQSQGGRHSNNLRDVIWRSHRRRSGSTEPTPQRSEKLERSFPCGHQMLAAGRVAIRREFLARVETGSTRHNPRLLEQSCLRSSEDWDSPSYSRELSVDDSCCVENPSLLPFHPQVVATVLEDHSVRPHDVFGCRTESS